MSNEQFSIPVLQNSRSLTSDLVNILRQQIVNGNLKPGDKLPTSKEIEEQARVSRSVIREAIAALKAERLIISRQGIGIFVAESPTNKVFEIEKNEFASIKDAIQILELRMAVEVEMAAMAAKHRTDNQMNYIWDCLEKFNQQISLGNDAMKEDIDFHLSIAKSSGNPYFERFISYIGSGAVPSRDIINNYEMSFTDTEFLEMLQKEHYAIAKAIDNRDAVKAALAIRTHLGQSRERHLKITKNLKVAS